MNDESLQILKMVESGKLSADEAAKLLEAVEAPPATREPARSIRIRVLERGGKKETNLRLPTGLVNFLLQFAKPEVNWQGQYLDMAQVQAAIKAGQSGRIVELEHENGRVEIFLE